jgi:carbamoyl-phosphate synthase large subunit
MPKRTDLEKIMIIGSGPIVIGQACEFDYSGSQACKALREEGYKIVLVNSNPATIMTDPEMADSIYLEPLTSENIEKIIAIEKPQALLPTLGGQTALNLAAALAENGILQKYGVELIGANLNAIRKAEDRIMFREAMKKIGLAVPKSDIAYSVQEAIKLAENIGYPMIIRPAYTLGGTGGGIAYTQKELEEIVGRGIRYSRIGQVLIEESVLGWKEYELEVMRDLADNVVIICSIENMDPMGVHTGDSITCAPAQTLTDKEYQKMRDYAIKIIREIGVETGGSNIQFAVHSENGKIVVIEMNPRVSRSSALASKATGFPIAKIAAKLAIGLTLDEIPNDITKETPASFEPTIDYVVVKIPRWPFDKFPQADSFLTTQMKSVGEVMAIGRTFEEAFQKALRSLEIKKYGLSYEPVQEFEPIIENLKVPTHKKIFAIAHAIRKNISIDKIAELTKIDKWFLYKIKNIIELEKEIAKFSIATIPKKLVEEAKKHGFSDKYLARLLNCSESAVRKIRKGMEILPTYKLVDTCAAEFEAKTPYYYSTYDKEDEIISTKKKKILIIGSGPNRIGQGVEFDYCCVHAIQSLRNLGYETIMVNCNPETVSTDYDTADRLYFEPLTFEDILNIIEKEKPEGIIVQLGGQTPINLAEELEKTGAKIIGTPVKSIDLAEDRKKFGELLRSLKLLQPENGIAYSVEDAKKIANTIGYPVLVRPSYVLGGRAMEIVYSERELSNYMSSAVSVSEGKPILIDKFLTNAIEVDVDAISDGKELFVAGILEHIEEAGVHSGDASMVLPPQTLSPLVLAKLKEQTKKIALALNTIGLINVQFAIQNGNIYVLEANPRASRTVPFVSKAIGIPIVKIATEIMVGSKTLRESLANYNCIAKNGILEKTNDRVAVKASVFPFVKLQGVDYTLGPEMKSTGEVMGIGNDFYEAYYKAMTAAGNPLPLEGTVFISVRNEDKEKIVPIAKVLASLGFNLIATRGTRAYLQKYNIPTGIVYKLYEGSYPDVISMIKTGKIALVINTPTNDPEYGIPSRKDGYQMRREAIEYQVPFIANITAAKAATEAIKALKEGIILSVNTLSKFSHTSEVHG